MARPGDIDSKSISVRIPMERYLQLLQEAISLKMSISELLTYKIFKDTPTKRNENKDVVKEEKEGQIIYEGHKFGAINKLYELKEKFKESHINNLGKGDAIEVKNHIVTYLGRNKCVISVK